MTGHEDRPDVMQRRRVNRLRAGLGLSSVPPYVGAELQQLAPLVAEQVTGRLRGDTPRYRSLSPDDQRRLLAAITGVADEFARIAEGRPPALPTAEAQLIELVRTADRPQGCLLALDRALDAVREVTRELWTRHLPQSSYPAQLDGALARYLERLGTRIMHVLHPLAAGPPGPRRAEEARLGGLLAHVEHRWGGTPTRLFVTVSAPTPEPVAPHRAPRDGVRRDGMRPYRARPLVLSAADHVVLVADQVALPTRSAGTTALDAVCIGPVPASEIAVAHDVALIRFYLVGAGVAASPSGVLPLPDLGFLRPGPSKANVRTITSLLRPLAGQSLRRRITLARTMLLRLQTSGTVPSLAEQREVNSQTVRNHLAALRTLYDHDLDFGPDTLAILAALELVLPMWEQEDDAGTATAGHSPTSPTSPTSPSSPGGSGELRPPTGPPEPKASPATWARRRSATGRKPRLKRPQEPDDLP